MNKEVSSNSVNKDFASLAIDPQVLAQELAAEIQGDPLDEIELESVRANKNNASNECDLGLKWLQQGHEERLQGLRVFCEHRDPRALPFLLPLLSEPCPVERMSAVYALGRNPSSKAVNILLSLLKNDSNAYVRKAAAWSLGNYSNAPVMKPLVEALETDVAAVRLWAASSLSEVGSSSFESAEEATKILLLSLQIDDEPVVRSNCIWSLGRLYEKLSVSTKDSLVGQLIEALLHDGEHSVRYEAQIVLEQMDDQSVHFRLKTLKEEGSLS